jgi:hypothetical protein
MALASVFRGYRDVQDFDLLAQVPPLQQRDYFSGQFADVNDGCANAG